VKSHLNNIFSKLRISGRIGLLTWAHAQTRPRPGRLLKKSVL
jgi:DNA-binding CsgD family transcriptional regulator